MKDTSELFSTIFMLLLIIVLLGDSCTHGGHAYNVIII